MNPPNLPDDNSRLEKSLTENVVCQWVGLAFLLFVIAAILFPVFAKVHEGNSHFSCQSDMKQLGLAIQQYQQDFDGIVPSGISYSDAPSTSHDGVGWGGQIYSYAKSTNLFRCPTEETANRSIPHVSYGYNTNIPRSSVVFGGLQTPTHTVLLFEVANAFADVTRSDEGASQGATEFSPVGDGTSVSLRNGHDRHTVVYATGVGGKRPDFYGAWPPARHQGGSNYLLADGHAKWFRPGQVSTGSDATHPHDGQTGACIERAAGTANPGYSITYSTK